jgi:hypothetical protein
MTRLTEADLQAIEARLKNATEFNHEIKPVAIPPQETGLIKTELYFVSPHIYFNKSDAEADAALIANAPQDLALLIAEVRLLQEVNRKAKDALEICSKHDCDKRHAPEIDVIATKALAELQAAEGK